MKNSINQMIPGPAGNIEAVVHYPKEQKPAIAIVCHPHPLFDGTMHNKVVTTLVKTFNELGMTAIRFNFRGIGKSDGKYDNTIGETDDLIAVINWAQENFPNSDLYLSGFSFGSFVAAKVVNQFDVKKLILIAPPVHDFNFTALPEFHCPWVVVQGDADEVVPADQVFAWVHSRKHQPELITMHGVGHFFHGKLVDLRERLLNVI